MPMCLLPFTNILMIYLQWVELIGIQIIFHKVKNCENFIEPESSVSHWEVSITGPYPKPVADQPPPFSEDLS
jgi:hypothetical protein